MIYYWKYGQGLWKLLELWNPPWTAVGSTLWVGELMEPISILISYRSKKQFNMTYSKLGMSVTESGPASQKMPPQYRRSCETMLEHFNIWAKRSLPFLPWVWKNINTSRLFSLDVVYNVLYPRITIFRIITILFVFMYLMLGLHWSRIDTSLAIKWVS